MSTAATAQTPGSAPRQRGKPRQAVVVIHGIGEQRPMDTLTGLVLGVLGQEKNEAGDRLFYSKPDLNADGFEERRYRAFTSDEDSDFIEFYWQHLMPIAGWPFMLSWLWLLMRRAKADVPPRFKPLWTICWIGFWLFIASMAASLAATIAGVRLPWATLPAMTGAAAAAIAAASSVVRSYVGDAAVYLNPHPRTVESRNKIRQAGVALLQRLHEDGRYDRIVVVGHSLGAVIGYDVLNFSWQRASETLRRQLEETGPLEDAEQERLSEAEAAAAGSDANGWRQAVRNLHYEQRRVGAQWLVTDFVSLGSPLAHAELLLARDATDFELRKERRELPTSPPFREDGQHFAYMQPGPLVGRKRIKSRVVDHAAVFAVTVWTNLYFPLREGLIRGDPIGGETDTALGFGIWDRRVTTRIRKGRLAHTEYWTRYTGMNEDPDAAPAILLDSLDLQRKRLKR